MQAGTEQYNEKIDKEYQRAVKEKFIEAIAHGAEDISYETFYELPELFDDLQEYIQKNNESSFLFNDAKDNLYRLISYFRYEHEYKTKEERINRFCWCNDMIGLLNGSNQSNAIFHYAVEISLRLNIEGNLEREQYNTALKCVYNSIIDDIILLESLDDELDFYEQYYQYFLERPFIIYNIDIITKQFPDAFYIEDYVKMLSILKGQQAILLNRTADKVVLNDKGRERAFELSGDTCKSLRKILNPGMMKKTIGDICNLIDTYDKEETKIEQSKTMTKKK